MQLVDVDAPTRSQDPAPAQLERKMFTGLPLAFDSGSQSPNVRTVPTLSLAVRLVLARGRTLAYHADSHRVHRYACLRTRIMTRLHACVCVVRQVSSRLSAQYKGGAMDRSDSMASSHVAADLEAVPRKRSSINNIWPRRKMGQSVRPHSQPVVLDEETIAGECPGGAHAHAHAHGDCLVHVHMRGNV